MKDNLSQGPSLTVLKIAAFVIIIAGMIFAKSILIPFLVALFISIICAQPIYWLQEKKVPKSIAIVIVLIGILSIFFGFGFLIGGEVASFTSNAPKYEASLKSTSDLFIQSMNKYGIRVTGAQFSNLFEPSRILNITAKVANELVNMMGNTFLVFLTILFMLLELSSLPDKLRTIFKGPVESQEYLAKISKSIRHYLVIKTGISIAVGIFIYITLSIIGLDYAVLWALLAGLLNYIPNIGSVIALIPTFLLALVQLGMGGATWVLISFLAVHSVIGNFIEPRLMGKGLGLSTLVVFLSLIFWGFIFGIVGMFLSVPLTITLKIVLEQNENTKWIAILLGTPEDAKLHFENFDKEKPVKKDKSPLG